MTEGQTGSQTYIIIINLFDLLKQINLQAYDLKTIILTIDKRYSKQMFELILKYTILLIDAFIIVVS